MKKLSFILTGLFLTVFLSSHFFIFKIAQTTHQDHFRAFITKDLKQLKKIEINPSQLYTDSKEITWLDDNQEIMIGNMLYDIVCKVNSGKTVSLFVMNDSDEKSLLDKYSRFADDVFNESNSSKPDVMKDFFSLKCLAGTPFEFQTTNGIFTYQKTAFSTSLAQGFFTKETPPPSQTLS